MTAARRAKRERQKQARGKHKGAMAAVRSDLVAAAAAKGLGDPDVEAIREWLAHRQRNEARARGRAR